jgi:hypothetical protein
MRSKLVQGRKSMICANSVLPAYMGSPRGIAPENLAETAFCVQVDTTLKVQNISLRSVASALAPSAQPDSSDAASQRNLAQWHARREHELLRDFDASTRNPGASRHTEGALERATEVADADAEKRGEIPDWNRGRKIRVDMYDEPMRLPGREAASLYLCCSTLARALSCR